MPEERIDEPIAAVASFEKGVVSPLAFTWGGRRRAIVAVHARWTTREGRRTLYHFSVETDSRDVYHVVLDAESMTWRIERVFLP